MYIESYTNQVLAATWQIELNVLFSGTRSSRNHMHNAHKYYSLISTMPLGAFVEKSFELQRIYIFQFINVQNRAKRCRVLVHQ